MPIGLYKIPDKDAKELGYSEAYIMGEYEIKGDKIIIGRAAYIYDLEKGNLVDVDPNDFKDLSGEPLKKAIELFKKYGAEVDIVFAVRTRKGSKTNLIALIGGKVLDE